MINTLMITTIVRGSYFSNWSSVCKWSSYFGNWSSVRYWSGNFSYRGSVGNWSSYFCYNWTSTMFPMYYGIESIVRISFIFYSALGTIGFD